MPADIATLSALKARVEAATGPDHGLWLEIVLALLDPAGTGDPALRLGRLMMSDGPSLFGDGTESVDAAHGLFRRGLPDTARLGLVEQPNKRWEAIALRVEPDRVRCEMARDIATAPLAILSALLTAKIAQLEVDHAR